jgi:hypothetical protein
MLLEIERKSHERLETRRMQWLGADSALGERLRHIADKKQQAERVCLKTYRTPRDRRRGSRLSNSRTDPRIAQDGEQVCASGDRLVDICQLRIRSHLPDHPRLRQRQPRFGPIDLDTVTLDYVSHRQPRPGEELLTLMRSNAPLDSGEPIVSHTPSLVHKPW